MIDFDPRYLVNLIFHIYMAFVAVYSAMSIFALLRYGQSKIVTLASALIFIAALGSFYGKIITMINQL